jgi:hypothetical protein
MIHYFNPGHETAVLNDSKFYCPPASVQKMQEDLAFLPAWYAAPDDYILFADGSSDSNLNLYLCSCQYFCASHCDLQSLRRPCHYGLTSNQEIAFWGISPQSVYYFEKLNEKYGLQLKIPGWNKRYRFGGSRFASRKILAHLIDTVPRIEKIILPQFFSDMENLENYHIQSEEKQLVKSPFSSSGRGLVWLPPGELAQSERQIIGGMLKRQSFVSIEKALDKRLDFSMHFENTPEGETKFIGYSIFKTNSKGAYKRSILANQNTLERRITTFFGRKKELLLEVQNALIDILEKRYLPHYKGNIGIDMMVYRSNDQFRLHPCVEINMRKSMGYLAIRLFENHLHPEAQGKFTIEYYANPKITCQKHAELQEQYPLVFENGLIRSGYRNLCPVTETSNYHAYIIMC